MLRTINLNMFKLSCQSTIQGVQPLFSPTRMCFLDTLSGFYTILETLAAVCELNHAPLWSFFI